MDMRHGGRLLFLLGLVFLFTLLASAVHAGRVHMSPSGSDPYRHSLTAVSRHHLGETDVGDMHTGLLTACKSCSIPQHLKPHQGKDACAAHTLAQLFATASAYRVHARPDHTPRTTPCVYALHPRPPTAPSHA